MGSSSGCETARERSCFRDGGARDGSASRSERNGPTHGFPRRKRIGTRREFLRVYEKGQRVASTSFVLYGLLNPDGRSRIGITVTRKCGGAVVRNRAKRLLREVFRRNDAEMRLPLDVVVNARAGLHRAKLADLEREFLARAAELRRRCKA